MRIIFCLFIFGFLTLPQDVFASEVLVQKDAKEQWRLFVDGRPYFVNGVDYRVTKIGQSPDDGTLKDWAYYDENNNGKCDPAYESWVDENNNGRRDEDETPVGDFELMRRMGVNTIRWYMNDFHDQKPNKALLRDLFKTYGIRVAVGNKFGAYTIDSGASWQEGTDYRDPAQRARMLESVKRMAEQHKDEPYLLMWLLGNENNLRFTNTNAARYPKEYAELLNEAARIIHRIDGKHPVALVNGDTQFLTTYRRSSPEIDIFGVNAYRGPKGFGDTWIAVRKNFDRPVLITEYGGSYAPGADEDLQAQYHEGCWRDIERNRADGTGKGNAIGGFAFEWMDEWWKAGDPSEHAVLNTTGQQGVGRTNWTQEYCGLANQGDGQQSPFLRRLRKVYFMYRKLWRGQNTLPIPRID